MREKLADWYARTQGLKYTRFRTMTALSRGQTPGPENSIGKLVNASKLQDIASFGLDLMGMAGLVMDDDLAEAYAMFQQALLSSPSARIAGGSDEILRNIIAERVLGLPAGYPRRQEQAVQPGADRAGGEATLLVQAEAQLHGHLIVRHLAVLDVAANLFDLEPADVSQT